MNKSIKKLSLKMYVLRARLKDTRLWKFFISAGRLFHSLGAADWRARSPSVGRHGALAGTNKVVFLDLRLYLDWAATAIRSTRYYGASPWRHLNVNNTILNSVLYLMGNQWRSFKMGVMWQIREVVVTSLATAFWTLWSLLMWTVERPYNRLL